MTHSANTAAPVLTSPPQVFTGVHHVVILTQFVWPHFLPTQCYTCRESIPGSDPSLCLLPSVMMIITEADTDSR